MLQDLHSTEFFFSIIFIHGKPFFTESLNGWMCDRFDKAYLGTEWSKNKIRLAKMYFCEDKPYEWIFFHLHTVDISDLNLTLVKAARWLFRVSFDQFEASNIFEAVVAVLNISSSLKSYHRIKLS